MPSAKRIAESAVTFHQLTLPGHANPYGHVHGGFIMKACDEAAAICAMRHAQRPAVTVAIDSMQFHSPVRVGQLICLTARLTYVGRTSMEIAVRVHAEDPIRGIVTHTNSAYFVFVALDDSGEPIEVPGLVLETEAEHREFAAGQVRQEGRLAERRRER